MPVGSRWTAIVPRHKTSKTRLVASSPECVNARWRLPKGSSHENCCLTGNQTLQITPRLIHKTHVSKWKCPKDWGILMRYLEMAIGSKSTVIWWMLPLNDPSCQLCMSMICGLLLITLLVEKLCFKWIKKKSQRELSGFYWKPDFSLFMQHLIPYSIMELMRAVLSQEIHQNGRDLWPKKLKRRRKSIKCIFLRPVSKRAGRPHKIRIQGFLKPP